MGARSHAWWEQHPEGLPLEAALAADGARRKVADTGQVSMFDLLGLDADTAA